jgi:hypothetical protein
LTGIDFDQLSELTADVMMIAKKSTEKVDYMEKLSIQKL